MLNQPTLEKLQTMKLHGMADAFRAQLETTDTSQLSFEERFAMLVDQQWLWKENRALARRLRAAKLKERGVVEDIDYQHPRTGSQADSHARQQRMGTAASECAAHRSHWNRKNLVRLCPRAKSLPRRLHHFAQTGR